MTNPVWLTATPPTPNGDLHLGHMAGPYVAADVMRRYLIAEDVPVLMTTGMDDHQSYVPAQGQREGWSGLKVADTYIPRIADAWREAGVFFDRIIEPRQTPGYIDFVQAFFLKLYDGGFIEPRTRPLPYCTECERWLYEAHVNGGCPHCGVLSGGNACEACARPNDCGDLTDPRCNACGTPAELREQTRLYLPLAPFTERLEAFWARTPMPPHLRAVCRAMAADGLPDIAVSHPTDWGVPVPVTGFTDQRIYVWFEMAPGYLLESHPQGARPATGAIQFFGFDNSYFHAVLHPALFMAWDEQLPLASAFVVNELYLLEGIKFSTSRRHAVWAVDGLAEAGVDAVRYHVLRHRPNGRQTSFSRGDLKLARSHLHEQWNGWLGELASAVSAETVVVPDELPAGDDWRLLQGRLVRLVAELREAYSLAGFDPRRTVDLLDEVVRCARDFGDVQRHERDRGAYRSALTAQLAVARALAAWAAPALPAGASLLAAALGVPAGGRVDATMLSPPLPGTRLGDLGGMVFGS